MERFNRAVRRHHVARLKKARKYYWGYPRRIQAFDQVPDAPAQMDEHQLGRVVQNPQTCSCSGCGNERRNGWETLEHRLTMQERRFLVNYGEQMQDE